MARRHLAVVLLAFVTALSTASMSSAAPRTGPPSIDNAVQVTGDPGASRAHTAPVLAVDPRDSKVIALAEADVYSSQCSVHISTNGGLSWSPAARPTLPAEYPNCSFVYFGPVVDITFASDGTLFYALSGYNPVTKKGRVYLARSSDLGSTWDTAALPWIAPNADKGELGIDAGPSVAVDPNDPKRVAVGWGSNWASYTLTPEVMGGKLYYWDVIERVYASVSADGGRTFGDAVNLGDGLRISPAAEGVKPPPQVMFGNDGQVYGVFGEYSRAGTRDDRTGQAPPAKVYFATSTDGGKTYEKKAIFTGPQPTATSDWTWVPRGVVDRKTGNIVVAWENMSAADDAVEISAIRSADGGKTWSTPVKASDDTPKRKWNYPEAYPSIAMAPDGRVDLVWYDGRNDPTFVDGARSYKFQDVYYSYSTDGGATWAPNLRVNDRAIDRRFGPSTQGGIRGPAGLASLDSGAYLAWDDSRNGTPENASQDIYFTRARIAPVTEFFGASSGGGTSSLAWAFLGAAIALAVGGLALVAVVGTNRRRQAAAAPAKPQVGAGVG
ncbi:MAG: sialidase family protein [Acidimicrobiales bacterium]